MLLPLRALYSATASLMLPMRESAASSARKLAGPSSSSSDGGAGWIGYSGSVPTAAPKFPNRPEKPGPAGAPGRFDQPSDLTRRANHRHIFMIAAIEPAPKSRLRAF